MSTYGRSPRLRQYVNDAFPIKMPRRHSRLQSTPLSSVCAPPKFISTSTSIAHNFPPSLQLNIYKILNFWHFSIPHFPQTEYPSHPSQWQKTCEQSVSNPAFLPPKPNHSLTTKQTSKTPPAQPAPSSSLPPSLNRLPLPLLPSSKLKLLD